MCSVLYEHPTVRSCKTQSHHEQKIPTKCSNLYKQKLQPVTLEILFVYIYNDALYTYVAQTFNLSVKNNITIVNTFTAS